MSTALNELIELGLFDKDPQSGVFLPTNTFDRIFVVTASPDLHNPDWNIISSARFIGEPPFTDYLNKEDLETPTGTIQNVFVDIITNNKHYVRDLTVPERWVIQPQYEDPLAIMSSYNYRTLEDLLLLTYKQCRIDMINNLTKVNENE